MPAKIKYPVVNGMKECGVCGEIKPISEYQKARRHYQARCNACQKIYAAEYRKRPEVRERTRQYHIEYMKVPGNRELVGKYRRKRNKRPDVKIKRNGNRRDWSAREKQRAVDYKGGCCMVCGYSTCLACLDFHHPDPSVKNGYGTGALKSHRTFEQNKPEIDKCVLVCVRCHREIHAGVTKCPSVS